MVIISEEEFAKLKTIEDFHGLRNKIDAEVSKLNYELVEKMFKENVENYMDLFASSQHIRILENSRHGVTDIMNSLINARLDEALGMIAKILKNIMGKNEKISEESKTKLKELEAEIAKVSKSRSLFGNVSLSLFKSELTGMDI